MVNYKNTLHSVETKPSTAAGEGVFDRVFPLSILASLDCLCNSKIYHNWGIPFSLKSQHSLSLVCSNSLNERKIGDVFKPRTAIRISAR